MVIGAAVKEGATRGLAVTPVFSLYSPHGPVFRLMLRVRRSAEWPHAHYGFAGHCHVHGGSRAVGWEELGAAQCRCG
jgi:tRNA (guanine26-N2/guanine27-N2)-dimethyltransferase